MVIAWSSAGDANVGGCASSRRLGLARERQAAGEGSVKTHTSAIMILCPRAWGQAIEDHTAETLSCNTPFFPSLSSQVSQLEKKIKHACCVKDNGPHSLLGRGSIRRCSLIGVDLALLEEVCH